MINSYINLGLIIGFSDVNQYKIDFRKNNKYHAEFNISNYYFDKDFKENANSRKTLHVSGYYLQELPVDKLNEIFESGKEILV